MVQECFGNDTGVKVYQGPAVAVPFLQRGYAFFRHRDLQAFVVLPDPVMGFFVVVLFKEDLPVPVQFFQREEFLCFCFRSKSIDYLVELLDLALGLPTVHRCVPDPDGQLCQGELELFRNILLSAVKVAGIKTPITEDGIPHGIRDDRLLLVIVKTGEKYHPRVVVNGGGKVCLDLLPSLFYRWQDRSVFYVPLDEHHPVGLAETFGRAFPRVACRLKVRGTETGVE